MEMLLMNFAFGLLVSGVWCYTDDTEPTDMFNCAARELITCGNNMGLYSWEFCKARTPNTKRILSVHLDLRYQNRYCRLYDTPKNFGLTQPGDAMWVIKSCFGTFLLCLDVETPTTTATTALSTSEYFTDSSETTTERHGMLTYQPTDSPAVTEPTDVDALVETTHRVPDKNGSIIKPDAISNVEIIVNENEMLDFSTKVLLISAIATAGLCLICLVSTIGCLTIMRNGVLQTKRRQNNQIEAEETTVTSLPATDCEGEESIYNEIPVDKHDSVFDHGTTSSISDAIFQKESERHIYATVKGFSERTGITPLVTKLDENEYDRLRNVPRVSVSDSSTYNRLSDVFKEEKPVDDDNSQTAGRKT